MQDKNITQLGIDAICNFYETICIDKLFLPGYAAFATGVKSPFLNVVIDTRENRSNSDELIKQTDAFFGKHQQAYAWFVVPGNRDNDLIAHGFEEVEESPAMYFDLETSFSVPNMDGLVVKELPADDNLNAWIEPVKEAFGAEPEDDTYRALSIKIAQQYPDKLKQFLAYYNGEPVTSGTLFITDKSVMLHNLATKTAYTKRGFGTMLTLYLMQQAKDMGFKHAFLDSSVEGLNMYKKIGFKEYSTTIVYLLG